MVHIVDGGGHAGDEVVRGNEAPQAEAHALDEISGRGLDVCNGQGAVFGFPAGGGAQGVRGGQLYGADGGIPVPPCDVIAVRVVGVDDGGPGGVLPHADGGVAPVVVEHGTALVDVGVRGRLHEDTPVARHPGAQVPGTGPGGAAVVGGFVEPAVHAVGTAHHLGHPPGVDTLRGIVGAVPAQGVKIVVGGVVVAGVVGTAGHGAVVDKLVRVLRRFVRVVVGEVDHVHQRGEALLVPGFRSGQEVVRQEGRLLRIGPGLLPNGADA